MALLCGHLEQAQLRREVLAVSCRGPDSLEMWEGRRHTAKTPWLEVFTETRVHREAAQPWSRYNLLSNKTD